MKTSKHYKIELATSDDARREKLKVVCVEDNMLVATDAVMLVSVPVDDAPDGKHVMDRRVLIDARKGQKVRGNPDTLEFGLTKAEDSPDYGVVDSQFPPYKQVYPKLDRKEIRVAFNPGMLFDLCKALGWEKAKGGAVLSFAVDGDGAPLEGAPIRVALQSPIDKEKREIAILMPCRL